MTVPAILGTARLGNFRLAYEPAALAAIRATRVRILLNGEDVRVRISGLSIRDLLNDAPNTCRLNIASPAPETGQALKISINSDAPRVLFAGKLEVDALTYEGRPTQLVYPCSAIDDTARLNRRRPIGTWADISVTTIALELIATFAPGFTAHHVAAGLPPTSITFDGSDDFSTCLGQLATAIGGYHKVEELDVWLFQTDPSGDPPDPLEASSPTLMHDPPITASRDDSQLRTRVYGKGHAEALSESVAAGDTILPVDDVVMYNPLGGQVIASTTPDGAASEILTYTTTQTADAGAVVGPGVTPTTAPNAVGIGGTGLTVGDHTFAYTWTTAAGETVASPLSDVVITETVAPPGPVAWASSHPPFSPGAPAGTIVRYAMTISLDAARTAETTIGTALAITAAGYWLGVSWQIPAAALNRWLNIYRSDNGGTYYLIRQSGPNPQSTIGMIGGYTDPNVHASDASGINPPVSNTAIVGRASLTDIAPGPSGTTGRRVYMTAAGGSQLKLVLTIADNTTTTATISAADGSLGANVPTVDTSGLAQPAGSVSVGATAIPVSSTAFASAGGGWVRLEGNQLVRYTGLAGNALIGIPASGAGSIIASVFYNSVITAAPALIGVTGLVKNLQRGAAIHLWVQRDDLTAQAEAAARETTDAYTSDGVHEYTITDERRGEASLITLCDANLLMFSRPIVTVTYATRDVRTKSGKAVLVDLASPPIFESLTIQDVTITEIDIADATPPRFTVVASSVRFTIEDVLRRLAGS